jgi:hypothetical protein
VPRNALPWTPDYWPVDLPIRLHGSGVVRAAQRDVQSAPTRSEMIARSGVPREHWYAPPPPVVGDAPPQVPTVSASRARSLAQRVLALRAAGFGRRAIGEHAGLGTGGKIVRIERGGIEAGEVAQLEATLREFELLRNIIPEPIPGEVVAVVQDSVVIEVPVDRSANRSERWADQAQALRAYGLGTRCKTCSIWWTGASTVHCVMCHRTFTTINVFDLHRVGPADRRECLDPATLKDHDMPLRQVERGGVMAWTYPINDAALDRLRALQADD